MSQQEVLHASYDAAETPEQLVSASECRRRLGRILFAVQADGARMVVLRYGRPVAAVVPVDHLGGVPEA
jgi:prevent-host-death family protein